MPECVAGIFLNRVGCEWQPAKIIRSRGNENCPRLPCSNHSKRFLSLIADHPSVPRVLRDQRIFRRFSQRYGEVKIMRIPIHSLWFRRTEKSSAQGNGPT